MMNEYAGLVRCYCLPGQVPTVAELAVEIQQALPYTEEPIATEMRDMLQQLPTSFVSPRKARTMPNDDFCF